MGQPYPNRCVRFKPHRLAHDKPMNGSIIAALLFLFVYLLIGTRGLAILILGAMVGGLATAVLVGARMAPLGAIGGFLLGAGGFLWANWGSAGEGEEA